MAKIVLGMGTSHGPMLSTPPDQWVARVEFDKKVAQHAFRGGRYSFDELRHLRAAEGLATKATPDNWRHQHIACRAAIDQLALAFAQTAPDVVIIVGNDQMEIFSDANLPAFMVFHGTQIENIPYSELQKTRLGPGLLVSEWGHHGTETETYRGHPELAHHLISGLMGKGFDVATSRVLPELALSRSSGIPHAYGFVYRQIMRERATPSVPVFVNTFYPPNQPSMRRCLDFGLAMAEAIETWDSPARVAVVGSGGLSHFVVDEMLDREVLDAMQSDDLAALSELDEGRFNDGTSEVRNWLPLVAAMAHARLPMRLIDYQACYRSDAGTGNGLAFAAWS
jgi:hypothetical protein